MNAPPNANAALLSRISIDPAVCHGKPVIRGLRYPVESLLEYLAGGDSLDDVLAEFPDLEREDLQACIQFAAQSLNLERKMDEQEEAEEAENQWHTNMDGLTRKS